MNIVILNNLFINIKLDIDKIKSEIYKEEEKKLHYRERERESRK